MDYALVEKNQIVATEIPEVGVLPDGRQVSGFDKLDPEVLKPLGWLPVQDSGHPEIDPMTKRLDRKLELKAGVVTAVYTVVDLPTPAPPMASPQDQIDAITALLVSKGVITKADVAATKVVHNPPPAR